MGHLYAVGLAGGGDSQLLFMQSAVAKMDDTAKKPQLLKKYF